MTEKDELARMSIINQKAAPIPIVRPFTLWRAAQAWAVLFRNSQVRSAELIFILCANET